MILALSGYKYSGKDTIAQILVQKHGFRRIAFADVLKDMVAEQYGIDRKSLDDPERKEAPILSLPVDPKDRFSEMISDFLIREFRTAANTVPTVNDDEYFWTPRALAILEGSVKRSVNSKYWVQRALSQIKPEELVVITDMRYRSEASQVSEYGIANLHSVYTVRIKRFDQSPSTDPSERDLDSFVSNFDIHNTGSMEDLEKAVDALMSELPVKLRC